jgi:NADPH:quinone reductase-like Zn-dependent oxidoreductase
MKAVVLTRTGGPDVLRVLDWPDPAVGAGEVRIAVRAAGVSFAETIARVGLYPATPKRPCVLGYEVAGEVETIGPDVSGLVLGQRVMAGTEFGGQAELATARARDVMPMPDHLSFEEGAAFCVNYGTAYAALMIMGGLRERDRVLIHSAAGGVGIAATQVARNVGAEIFGGKAHCHFGARCASSDRLPQPRLQGRGPEAHQWGRGRRRDGRDGTRLVSQGLPDLAAWRPTDHVRPFRRCQ